VDRPTGALNSEKVSENSLEKIYLSTSNLTKFL
jgi:hypothetical protein